MTGILLLPLPPFYLRFIMRYTNKQILKITYPVLISLLMEHMIGDARAKGRKGLILTCKDRLIHYYEKFGYKNMGVSASVHGGAVWYDMLLEFEDQKS